MREKLVPYETATAAFCNHPVAFVDAWVDDANNEPLVSIMSAIDDALQPFLKSKNVREKLGI
ncbi:hypothetical protein QP162_00005 [Sphingomonas aurantiaca]|uniref:hypothetical protein n=1 Tax=Sphingomonas aurantiaca TaxID=185949 RepID=UPI002FE24910